jgi:hypothetical protein
MRADEVKVGEMALRQIEERQEGEYGYVISINQES